MHAGQLFAGSSAVCHRPSRCRAGCRVRTRKTSPSPSRSSPRHGRFAPVRAWCSPPISRAVADDYEEFYCATVEWDWGDGNKVRTGRRLRSVRGRQERDQAALHVRSTSSTRRRLPRRVPAEAEEQGCRHVAATTIKVRPGMRDRRHRLAKARFRTTRSQLIDIRVFESGSPRMSGAASCAARR